MATFRSNFINPNPPNPYRGIYNIRSDTIKTFPGRNHIYEYMPPKYNYKRPGYRISTARRRIMTDAALRAVQAGVRRLKRRYGSTTVLPLAKRPRILQSSRRRKKKYKRIVANTSGTTHTTSRMIVRKTPQQQKFMRKLFREGESNHVKYVQRFGFSFVGAANNNEAIWYSVTHLKFNNICDMLAHRVAGTSQETGAELAPSTVSVANQPTNFIYLGKCTFNYELYNPTNYNMTVYIYDLICKNDTPHGIKYGSDQTTTNSCSPEICMQASSTYLHNATDWYVADPTSEVTHAQNAPQTDPTWRTVGMKPTDYFYFNAMWKVKGMKKIILPPASAHHHVVIFNPKQKITLGTFMFKNQNKQVINKHGVGGLTQSTLFGIEGQVATEADQQTDNEKVGTLPGKLVIKCIRKMNVYNFNMKTSTIIQKNQLQKLDNVELFSDLFENHPEHT